MPLNLRLTSCFHPKTSPYIDPFNDPAPSRRVGNSATGSSATGSGGSTSERKGSSVVLVTSPTVPPRPRDDAPEEEQEVVHIGPASPERAQVYRVALATANVLDNDDNSDSLSITSRRPPTPSDLDLHTVPLDDLSSSDDDFHSTRSRPEGGALTARTSFASAMSSTTTTTMTDYGPVLPPDTRTFEPMLYPPSRPATASTLVNKRISARTFGPSPPSSRSGMARPAFPPVSLRLPRSRRPHTPPTATRAVQSFTLHWPPPQVNKHHATRSLAYVSGVDAPFEGPVPAAVLLGRKYTDETFLAAALGRAGFVAEPPWVFARAVTVLEVLEEGSVCSGVALKGEWPRGSGVRWADRSSSSVRLTAQDSSASMAQTVAIHGGEEPLSPQTTLVNPPSPTSPGMPVRDAALHLVAKLSCPTQHPLGAEHLYGAYGREAWVYTHRLASLQGSVVPRWHGVYVSRQRAGGDYFPGGVPAHIEVLAAVTEDAGDVMSEISVATMSDDDKHTVLDKYHALHAAGVVHGSARVGGHWVVPAGWPVSEMRITGFGQCVVRNTMGQSVGKLGGLRTADSPGQWKAVVEEEVARVRRVLWPEGE